MVLFRLRLFTVRTTETTTTTTTTPFRANSLGMIIFMKKNNKNTLYIYIMKDFKKIKVSFLIIKLLRNIFIYFNEKINFMLLPIFR